MWFDNININYRVKVNYIGDLQVQSDGEQFVRHLIEMGGANGLVCSFWPCLSTFSVSENVIIYKYFLYFLQLHVGRFRAENSIP